MEMDTAHPSQTNINRPSTGIPRVREREGNQGTPDVMTLRLTSKGPATRGAN